jgi:biotin transporter BioY
MIFHFSFAETITLAVAPFVAGEMIKSFVASGVVTARE